ncbi:MAG: hypothetical protein EXS02_08290 [Planctomycetes bacterium]|nr:hypothetical protein [Planctomycetota bacterium]
MPCNDCTSESSNTSTTGAGFCVAGAGEGAGAGFCVEGAGEGAGAGFCVEGAGEGAGAGFCVEGAGEGAGAGFCVAGAGEGAGAGFCVAVSSPACGDRYGCSAGNCGTGSCRTSNDCCADKALPAGNCKQHSNTMRLTTPAASAASLLHRLCSSRVVLKSHVLAEEP